VYRDYDKIKRSLQLLSKQHRSRVILSKFYSEEIGLYLEAADLYVGRGGAMSCYEVGVTSTPSIIIPIPWVQKNEQYHNAEVLEEIGLAKILQEGVLSPEILVQEIDKMIEKIRNNELDVDEKKKNKYFVRDGAEKIVNELENFVEI
jgi:UDP-N-acetylglucosamine--N-acetylmuramyl-(pentapeptide) pyrophosphoryl-undecaprenol N-acetylglucosamine transferase